MIAYYKLKKGKQISIFIPLKNTHLWVLFGVVNYYLFVKYFNSSVETRTHYKKRGVTEKPNE